MVGLDSERVRRSCSRRTSRGTPGDARAIRPDPLAEGFSTADLRHGPIATAFAGVPVLLIDAGGPTAPDTMSLREMLRARGADVALLPLPVSGLPEPAQAIASVVRGQQVARSLALAKGVDPDAPPGLTKVTPTT